MKTAFSKRREKENITRNKKKKEKNSITTGKIKNGSIKKRN
jgi:hypothetical protein